MKITRTSTISGEENTLDLPVTQEQLARYYIEKVLLQEAFPNLNAAEREFIKSGITEDEWKAMFGVLEEESPLEAYLIDNYPDADILLADGFDEAFMGIASQANKLIAVYDREKCLKILEESMSRDEAVDYFEFNVVSAYVGENTPAFVDIYRP